MQYPIDVKSGEKQAVPGAAAPTSLSASSKEAIWDPRPAKLGQNKEKWREQGRSCAFDGTIRLFVANKFEVSWPNLLIQCAVLGAQTTFVSGREGGGFQQQRGRHVRLSD